MTVVLPPIDFQLRWAAVALTVWVAAVFGKALYDALCGRLSHIPGPFANRISYWPLKLATIKGQRIYCVDRLHAKYGPCVLLSPEEVSVSDIGSVKEIHRIGGGFHKAPWYGKFTQERLEEKEKGIFAMQDPKIHSERRKLFANGFSKASLDVWEDVLQSKVAMAVEGIKRTAESNGGKADILAWWTYMANDMVATLAFGDSFKSLETGKKTQFINDLEIVMKLSGISAELPFFAPILRRIMPNKRLASAGSLAIAQSLELEKQGNQYRGTIFSKMMTAGEENVLSRAQIEREASNLIVAGSDTTAVSTTYLVYAVLSAQPSVKHHLIEEVKTLASEFTAQDAVDLPLLSRVIKETLRLYGAAPGALPRTVPKDGRMLGGHFIPAGATVSTQAYTLHRDSNVFADAEQWLPDRWIDPTQAMKDAYMPFGAGTRVCIGSHLATLEMALAAAVFFRELGGGAKLAPETTADSMRFENYFLIAPKSHRCIIEV